MASCSYRNSSVENCIEQIRPSLSLAVSLYWQQSTAVSWTWRSYASTRSCLCFAMQLSVTTSSIVMSSFRLSNWVRNRRRFWHGTGASAPWTASLRGSCYWNATLC